ncbi:deoxynucleoside kinase [Gracilibacillus boraciitolerans]|uniref:deoxynucleoside kinase n=1 Tax=Gracilibacillus boraciitolerans TaxID=307521 RepID=UPI001F3B3DE0|nr:deoxynucleoside kinase [Gracilibacillus boraciitolerans]
MKYQRKKRFVGLTVGGRSYEVATENAYWERLNKEYREYFEAYNASPVLKINVDQLDFENNPADRDYVLSLIRNELEALYSIESKLAK